MKEYLVDHKRLKSIQSYISWSRQQHCEEFCVPFPALIWDSVMPMDSYNTLADIVKNAESWSEGDTTEIMDYSRLLLEIGLKGYSKQLVSEIDISFKTIVHFFREFIQSSFESSKGDARLKGLWGEFKAQDVISDFYELSFRKRKNGYRVPAHTDGPHLVGTCLFYLPTDNDDSDLGTIFYEIEPGSATDYLMDYCTIANNFNIVNQYKKVSFVPNRVVFFLNNPFSIHGNECFKLPKNRITANIGLSFNRCYFHHFYSRLSMMYLDASYNALRHCPDAMLFNEYYFDRQLASF